VFVTDETKSVSKLLTITSSMHRRINVVQSMVDTWNSPPLMCRLVLWGTVCQVNQLVWHKNLLNSLKTAGNCVFCRESAIYLRRHSAEFIHPLRYICVINGYAKKTHLIDPQDRRTSTI